MPDTAYVVLAHKTPRQVARLVKAVAGDDTRCYVHVDRRSPRSVHRGVRELLGERADVRLLRPRRTAWGSAGLLLATLDGLRAARQDGARTVMVLSAQDYPVRPPDEISAFLAAHDGTSFLEHQPLPRPDWPPPGGLERYDARGVRLLGRTLLRPDRRSTRWLPRRQVDVSPLQPHHGGQFCCLSAAACDEVLSRLAEGSSLLRSFRAVQIPDETAIHTVLAGSSLASTVVDQVFVYADWIGNGDHPEDLRAEHLERLRTTAHLFARKFDLERQPELLDRVDVELRGTTPLLG